MIFVTGGIAQGKKSFVKARESSDIKFYDLNNIDIDFSDDIYKTLDEYKVFYNMDKFIRNHMDKTDKIDEMVEYIISRKDCYILMTDVGNGIIPVEKSERIYREMVGRTGCRIAEMADEVYRLTVGIASRIK